MTIGAVLKQARKDAGLSQAEAAADICSQAMLLAIESNKYTPNVTLVIALCQRLGITLDVVALAQNFAIGQQKEFNQQVNRLCNAHQYQELLAFLNTDKVIDSIADGAETQAYYYYLAVAEFQGAKNWDGALQDLQLCLANAAHTKTLTTLTRLATISAAYIETLKNQQVSATIQNSIDRALDGLSVAQYTENLNIVYYLAALLYFHVKQDTASAKVLARGIHFTTAHNSHYMLANDYYLLAKIAHRMGKTDDADAAAKRSQLFTELFGEAVFTDFD
ncbi:MAG: helix-turn-helix domain-containing protein [Schleiferilactobacillus harbinensis]|jgi:transcriptional regulator with XRE-family HTH domain|nr:helix-turn-helix domain-containing protein [Schleiferilactobacillus harbinensis]MCI1913684.1 helix-turn-helix domain-containing protein [Schleiferilactobacillus harbinensis]